MISIQMVLLSAMGLMLVMSVMADGPSPQEVVVRWTQFYGKDTGEAATLTTAHFRDGEAKEAWAENTHKVLEDIGYGHLGGIIENETISGEVATVTLKARIVAIDGISTQTEVYTLKQVSGQWLIDDLEVRDEVVPRGKLPYAF